MCRSCHKVALCAFSVAFLCLRTEGGRLTPETQNVLDNLKAVAVSPRVIYSWCEDWQPDDSADRGRTAPCISASGGRETLVYNTELYRVTGAYRTADYYGKGRARTLALVKRLYRERKAIAVFAWHPENPYLPSAKPQKGDGWNAASPYNYNYKCKGCPPEDRYVIRDILSATNRPCLAGRYPSPRVWFDERLGELASFFRDLKDDDGRPIPCGFRLWHECEDDWMWWGKGSVSRDDYVAFFRYTVIRLRELTDGGRNILFGYCTDKNWKTLEDPSSPRDWQYRYPGDDVVDIVGLDDYTFGKWPKLKADHEKFDLDHPDPYGDMEEKLGKSIGRLRLVSAFAAAHGKACAMFETGFKPNPPGTKDAFCSFLSRALSADGVHVAFVNTWISSILPKSEPGLADWKAFIASPVVLMGDSGLDLTRPVAK